MTARPTILLVNPNSSAATTAMMVRLAEAEAGDAIAILGATARAAPGMIVTPEALAASGPEVAAIARAHDGTVDGIVVAAFGDPGLDAVRATCRAPAIGIAEAAMAEAASGGGRPGEGRTGGRRFGIATTTPALAPAIAARAAALGHAPLFTGLRLTEGDPVALAADPEALRDALAAAARACIDQDGAEAVVIGGGPLGAAAAALQGAFAVPVIGPIPAAMRRMRSLLGL